MANRAAEKDLDLIELALRRLLSDDNLHDSHEEDAQSKLTRKEKDRELLLRLLDQLNSLKAERDQKDHENSLPADGMNPDTELHCCDKIGGQVRNEEALEEIRKVKKQNKFTHVILGIILASNVIWRFSELAIALVIRNHMSNPLRLIGSLGSFITGSFKGPVTENPRSPLLPRIETNAIPRFDVPQLPRIEVPSIFQTEDKPFHISNGKLGNGSSGQAEENISLFDLLLQNPSNNKSESE